MSFGSDTLKDASVVIVARGEINIGDDERLHRFVAGLPPNTSLVGITLSSPGGNYLEGVRLSTTIRNSRLITAVTPNSICASACFLMFAAGNTRMVFGNSRLGVHSASQAGSDTMSAQAVTTLMARKASEYGVPPAIIGKMVTTLPNDMTWLTADDYVAMGIIDASTGAGGQASTYQPGSALVPGSGRQPDPMPTSVPPPPAAGPPAVAAASGPAFAAGLQDRQRLEIWYTQQTGEYLDGANWWATNRAMAARSGWVCNHPSPVWLRGCTDAQKLFAVPDQRRKLESEYRLGWNSR